MSADNGRADDVDPEAAGSLWRTEIALRVRELRHRLVAVCAGDGDGEGGGEEIVAIAAQLGAEGVGVAIGTTGTTREAARLDGRRRACHIAATRQALEDANAAIRLRPGSVGRVRRWWSGQTITAAWEAVHRAEAELIEISSRGDALATLPQLRAWMRQVLTDRDELACYEHELDEAVRARSVDPALLRRAYQDTITANVDWHSSMRTFRNVIFGVAGALGLLLLVLATWHAIDADVLSLCRRGARPACFGEGARPVREALFEVLLVGALGGLLSSAFFLGKTERAPSRYNLLIPQIVLKAVAGAATALVGVILVKAHVFVAPVGGSSTAVLLAYAAVFGFSQQLLTQFVDRRGVDLLKPQQERRTARRR
jgi:hypothetical protein